MARTVYQPDTVNADSIFQDEGNSRLVECSDSDCEMESYHIDMSCIVSYISRLKRN